LVELVDVERSVVSASGESDLVLTVLVGGRRVIVLIENKVDAAFQPRQAERYRERAEGLRARLGGSSAVVTVLCCPEAYIADDAGSAGFDCCVRYEAILAWFEQAARPGGPLGVRGEHKCALLRGAIERGRGGYRMVPDEQVTAFWRSYWELAASVAPSLQMPKPAERPSGSTFIYFRPAALPAGVTLVHKVYDGKVDLQFAGQASRLAELHTRWRATLPASMQLEQAGNSAAVRIAVPPIDLAAPFAESEASVRRALGAAIELLHWYRTVPRAPRAE
jgi:hypothetical protein